MNTFYIFIAEYLTYIASLYAVGHIFFTHPKKDRIQNSAVIIFAACAAWLVTHFLKDLIAHPRPDLSLALVIPDSMYSFPSGHATYAAALAFATYFFDKRASIIVGIMALFIGAGRVLVGVHYWYDVLAGFLVGALVAYIVTKLAQRIRR